MNPRRMAGCWVALALTAGWGAVAGTPPQPQDDPDQRQPIIEPKLAGGHAVVKLPGEASEVAAAGGGRFLVIHMNKLQALAFFDISLAKVVRIVDTPGVDVHFASGLAKFFVANNDKNSISRYDLKTFKKELTISAPDGGVQWMGMGSASLEPLVVASGKQTLLYDPRTMRPEPLKWKHFAQENTSFQAPSLRMADDGTSIVAWDGGWAGLEVAQVDGQTTLDIHDGGYINSGAGPARIVFDGSLVFTPDALYSRDLTEPPFKIDGYGFGAQSPNYVLALTANRKPPISDGRSELRFYVSGGAKLIWTLKDVQEMAASSLPPEQRIWFVPQANVIAAIGAGNDQIILRRFKVAEALNDAGIDYLFVTSTPAQHAIRGRRYVYQIESASKRGGMAYSLASGPDDMTVTPAGKVQWQVPPDYTEDEARVIVSVKDDSGQEIFHAFTIHLDKKRKPAGRDQTRTKV